MAIPTTPLTQTNIPMDTMGFPSHFVSPKVKEQKQWCLLWNKSADRENKNGLGNKVFRMGNDDDEVNRAYSRGNQSIDKYKPILGIRQKTKKNQNPLNYKILSWEILSVAPKFNNLLVGKLIGQNNDVGISAVDKRAQDEKRKKRASLQEYITNKNFLDNVTKQTGIQFEGPDHDPSIPEPQNMQEVDMYIDMFYKERYLLVMQDMLKLLNEQDNYTEILKELAYDLVEIGRAATKTYRIGTRIKRRRCIPERMITSSSTTDNFENVQYIGEYWDLTIGELKEIAGAQFTEDEYKEISEKATGASYSTIGIREYYDKNLCYPWDKTKVTIQDLTWWSPDEEITRTTVNKFGEVEVLEKDYEWWDSLRKRGVTEDMYNKANKPQVIVRSLNNQYQSMWITNTEKIFNFGKSKDMLKNESDMGKTVGPYCMYALKGGSITKRLITVYDNIQINWLQYQHHAAKSRPSGPAIEFTALQDVSIEKAGGGKMSPKDVLELYFDTGILLWRRKDSAGNNTNFQPITELQNGLSPACMEHFTNVVNGIDMLRNLIGLNEMTDASTPNSEMGKAVAKMAAGGTQDALKYVHYSFDQLNIGTHLRSTMMISGMAATGLAPDYTEALGLENMGFLALMSDIGSHEYGCYLQKQPTEEMRARLSMYCQEGLSAGTLYPEECFEIENEPNIYRAIQLLKMYRQQKQKAAAEQQQQMYAQEQEKNANSANATEQAKRDTLSHEAELKAQAIQAEANAKIFISTKDTGNKAFLLNLEGKIKQGLELSAEEQHRITEMNKVSLAGEYQIAAAKAKPKTTSK